MGKPKEFSMSAAPAQVPAGKTTFVVANRGSSARDGGRLLRGGRGLPPSARRHGDEVGTEGEVPDVEPGAGGKLTVTLPPGKYVLLCNLPGHFAGGMYTNFVVK